MKWLLATGILGSLCCEVVWAEDESPLPERIVIAPSAVNRVLLGDAGREVAIYGVPEAAQGRFAGPVLLTHARRDVVPVAIAPNWEIVAPLAERALLEEPQVFWEAFATARFHDYAQQSTKVLAEPISVSRWVQEGEVMTLNGIRFEVVETPGFTRGAVSYVTEFDGTKIGFTGDLIYGDGKIFDLYSFQDKIAGAQIRGYHGYGSRLAELLQSLRRLKSEKLDVMVPTRGPVIRQPDEAIDRLTERVRAVYRNYLSTSALHWYFKEQRMRQCGERILGRGAKIELMPYCRYEDTPDWIFSRGTSRLLMSSEKAGFLLDCGNQGVIDAVQGLIDAGTIERVEGLFVTHFHDDHADSVQAAAEQFDCPVYALEEYEDVLENPSAYHLPAMTANPIREVRGMKDGAKQRWREFEFTYQFYPGQAYYHGALFVKKPGEKLHCFIGDSFAPSGIDDYCVLNRNLLHEDTGYQLCLRKLRALKEDYWIINEHIPHVFRFNDDEMAYLEGRYRERIELLKELFPWDDPNYGVDEQWAMFYPYGSEVAVVSDRKVKVQLRLSNHSPAARTFHLHFDGSDEVSVSPRRASVTLSSRQEGAFEVTVVAPPKVGHYLLMADVVSDGGMQFQRWSEAMISVGE